MQSTSRVRGANRLTALEVKKATASGVLEDGAGLRLLITKTGNKYWIVRLNVQGTRITRSLGSFPDLSLGDARDKADELRRAARRGMDPAIILNALPRPPGAG